MGAQNAVFMVRDSLIELGLVTIVRTEESWEGVVTRIFRARMQRMLQNAIDSGLRNLKTEV